MKGERRESGHKKLKDLFLPEEHRVRQENMIQWLSETQKLRKNFASNVAVVNFDLMSIALIDNYVINVLLKLCPKTETCVVSAKCQSHNFFEVGW